MQRPFEVTWAADSISHIFMTTAESETEAIKHFYNVSSGKATITKVRALPLLKIKDGINLDELLQFGFEERMDRPAYEKHISESDCSIRVSKNDRVIYHDNWSAADMSYGATQLIVAIYDLIEAGLIEKI